jgi:hypothetical protein
MDTGVSIPSNNTGEVRIIPNSEINDIFNESKQNERRDELEAFLKVIVGKPHLLEGICEFGFVDGSNVSDCCAPIPDFQALSHRIFHELVINMLKGMKANGKAKQWKCGFLGSRWLDMDPRKYGLDSIRCAFYSKKYAVSEWKYQKPYVIQIMLEKAK